MNDVANATARWLGVRLFSLDALTRSNVPKGGDIYHGHNSSVLLQPFVDSLCSVCRAGPKPPPLAARVLHAAPWLRYAFSFY